MARGLFIPDSKEAITAVVNGREMQLAPGMTIAALLELLAAPKNGIAVACNDQVVRRSEIGNHALQNGDRVEIIRAVAGG